MEQSRHFSADARGNGARTSDAFMIWVRASPATFRNEWRVAIRRVGARLRVALRHAARPDGTDAEPVAEFGGIRVDLDKRDVRRGGEPVHLTPTEYRVLSTLARHPGRVMTHRQLLQEVWGPYAGDQTHSLRVHMTQLRHKLEKDPARPRHLTTEIGVGYRLQVD